MNHELISFKNIRYIINPKTTTNDPNQYWFESQTNCPDFISILERYPNTIGKTQPNIHVIAEHINQCIQAYNLTNFSFNLFILNKKLSPKILFKTASPGELSVS